MGGAEPLMTVQVPILRLRLCERKENPFQKLLLSELLSHVAKLILISILRNEVAPSLQESSLLLTTRCS